VNQDATIISLSFVAFEFRKKKHEKTILLKTQYYRIQNTKHECHRDWEIKEYHKDKTHIWHINIYSIYFYSAGATNCSASCS
jgi:hypothetical protein